MAQKLRVSTPKTRDGVNLILDEKNQVVYTESILELSARKNLESLNAKLPQNLRHKFEVIEVEEAAAANTTNADLKKRLAELEREDENAKLRARIAELEGGTAGQVSVSGGESAKRNAEDVIADIQAATTVEDVQTLADRDARKTVIAAAAKRIGELEAK